MPKEEAIKLLRKLRETIDRNNAYGEAEEMAIKALEYDDAKYHEEHGEVIVDKGLWEDAKKALEQEPCKDVISRQAAIKVIDEKAKRIKNADTLNGLAGAVGILFDLPPVTPQPKADKVIKMRDATPEERESIDKYIKSISKPTGVDFDSLSDSQTIHHLTDKAYSELCLLAEKGREALQTNSDAISREAVLQAVSKGCQEWRGIYDRCEEFINALPPVKPQEPKTGHWIADGEMWKCSKCGELSCCQGKFCNDCGARMFEPQESEVRNDR